MSYEGRTISTCLVYEPVQVEVVVENPLRRQTITNIVKVAIYKDVTLWLDERMKKEPRVLTLPPLQTRAIYVGFTPIQEFGYYYVIHIEDKMIDIKSKCSSQGLRASRIGTTLTLNETLSDVPSDSIVTFTGRLVRIDTGEGIAKAEIGVYDRDVGTSNLMASGTTESDGIFGIEWIAEKMDRSDNTVETCAEFRGDDVYKPSRSNRYVIYVT